MSKSLDFCKWVAKERSNYGDRDFSQATEYSAKEIFHQYMNGETEIKLTGKDDDGEFSIDITVEFNPDADFHYCTSASSCHDGSLLFLSQCIEKCVYNVIGLRTYDKTVGEPQSGDHIKYTVGNFVVINEYDTEKFATEEKPWLMERTTVMLPLVMTKIKEN